MLATDTTRHRTGNRSTTIRAAKAALIASAALALAPMAVAVADDGPTSPAAPIIRSADRGSAMSGLGEQRTGTKIPDAHGISVFVQGGDASAGSPIMVNDGNLGKLPRITGEAGVICSSGQHVRSAMIPCFG